MIPENEMPFETALSLLKSGRRVARAGWNGKGMWLFLVDPVRDLGVNGVEAHPGVPPLPMLPFLAMKTADMRVVPWLAPRTHILARDWCHVE